MQIIYGYQGLTPDQTGATVALGNFDGVHRGHAAVIESARALAPEAKLGVVSFDPHPRHFFQPDAEPFTLTPLVQKAEKIKALGVDILYILRFDKAMSTMTPEAFVRDVLVNGIGAVGVSTGSDFRFGANRAGDSAMLETLSARYPFKSVALPELSDENGGLFSSSTARNALREGKPEDATTVLGRPYTISGPVLEGDQRGRTIGFPTANLSLENILAPAFGVYAVTVKMEDRNILKGVANIGMRPTFEKTVPILEAHLFDFDQDIYGQTIEISLLHYIRAEQKFDGIDALKAQIASDADAARTLLT